MLGGGVAVESRAEWGEITINVRISEQGRSIIRAEIESGRSASEGEAVGAALGGPKPDDPQAVVPISADAEWNAAATTEGRIVGGSNGRP